MSSSRRAAMDRDARPRDRAPAPATVGASGTRAVMASTVCFALLAVAWLAAGWSADPRPWGLHALAFLPRTCWILAVLACAFLAVPQIAATVGTEATRAVHGVLTRRAYFALLCGGALALFFWLRLPFQFLGDGTVWLDKIDSREEFHHFEPLATSIASAVAHAAGNLHAAGWPSIALGLVYLITTAALCRALWSDTHARGLAWLLAIVHPALLLFFGYVESYPYLLALQAVFALVVVRAAAGTSPLFVWLASITLGLAIATHLQAIAWLPALALLPWARAQRSATPGAAGMARARIVAAAVAAAGALVVAVLAMLFVHASPLGLLAQLGGESAFGGLRLSTFFAAHRLLDLGNELFLVLATSLLLLVPACIAAGRAALRLDGVWIVIAALLPGPLLFLMVVPPRIGGARDWDLFLSVFLPTLLLAVEVWRRALAGVAASRVAALTVAGRALGFACVVTLAWLGVQLDASRAAQRLYVLQLPAGTCGNFARGYANETLAQYWRDRDVDKALEAYRRATEANPSNPRYFNNLAILNLRKNQIDEARVAFRRAYGLGMHEWFVLHNLGLCELQRGRPAAAESLFDELVRVKPAMWQGWSNRGLARLDLGRPAEALPDLDRALRLAPQEADVYYNRGLALRDVGRTDEARASFNAALRLAPAHTQARDALSRLPAAP